MPLRALVLAAAVTLAAVGCGGGGASEQGAAPKRPGTLEALLDRAGPDVALTPGTSDYQPGLVRLSYLIVTADGRVVKRNRARVWISTGLKARPFATTTAALEPIGVHGSEGDAHDVTHLYVARFAVPRPGKYWVLSEPMGGTPIQAVGNLMVRPRTLSPPVGARAFPSRTPTIATARGDLAKLTTREPPDRELLRHSIADSLRTRRPFVVVFATPKFCTSRTCGPVVDVVEAVRQRFAATRVRFIHVEVYKDNNPKLGLNRWMREWQLPTEPWVFLVGGDGRIKAKFEGSVSPRELEAAVRRHLVPS